MKKDNEGVLFIKKERKSEKSPNRDGQMIVDGKEYWISGWDNKAANGSEYISLKFRLKEPKPQDDAQQSTHSQPQDDGIPF